MTPTVRKVNVEQKHLIPNIIRSIKDTKSDPDLSSHSMRMNSHNFFITEAFLISQSVISHSITYNCPYFYTKRKQNTGSLWTSPFLRLIYIQDLQQCEYFVKLSIHFAALSNFKLIACSSSFINFLIGFRSLSLP